MENVDQVYPKYFSRLVVGNAPQIFSGSNRSSTNPLGNYPLLKDEVKAIRQDVNHARKIAESIETANEDLFRDFDLSTFMEHFKLDALEKTILALAFKIGPRSDLKTKGNFINCKLLIHHADQTQLMPSFLRITLNSYNS